MGNYTGNYKADLVIGVEVDERKGESWEKGAYAYVKYDVVGLVGIKLGEPNLIHINLRGVGSSVRYCSIGNFYSMTITLKLDGSGKAVNYFLTEGKKFRNSLPDLESKRLSTTDVFVFNKQHNLLYSTLDSKKAYFELFIFMKSSSYGRKVVLEIDIETMQENIVSMDSLVPLSYFSNYFMNALDCTEYLFDKLQDGVYVYGDIVVLYHRYIDTILLSKEATHAVFARSNVKEIVFGSSMKYISVQGKPFMGKQKLYISKDSSKEFVGALLQAIYFSKDSIKLNTDCSIYELQFIDGRNFYNICNSKINSEAVKTLLQDKEIIVY